jgi:hypothetical protein
MQDRSSPPIDSGPARLGVASDSGPARLGVASDSGPARLGNNLILLEKRLFRQIFW